MVNAAPRHGTWSFKNRPAALCFPLDFLFGYDLCIRHEGLNRARVRDSSTVLSSVFQLKLMYLSHTRFPPAPNNNKTGHFPFPSTDEGACTFTSIRVRLHFSPPSPIQSHPGKFSPLRRFIPARPVPRSHLPPPRCPPSPPPAAIIPTSAPVSLRLLPPPFS